MDVINDLAQFVVETDFEDLSDKLVAYEKDLVLDTLGCTLAGSSAPAIQELIEYVQDVGGREDSHIMVFGGKVPAMTAALANASMTQARDFDDTHDAAILHPHCSCWNAALAVAETAGSSGAEFLNAVILGVEVECRLGIAINSPLSFTRTGTLGYFGATAAAGKVMQLSVPEMVNAFGIVYPQVSTTLQSVIDGALVKRIHPGFAAQAAVLSCNLAQKGVTGCQNVLEGQYGYMNLYENGSYERSKIIDGLGKKYELLNISVKPYPCARDMHGALDAAVEMVRNRQFDFEQIDEVEIVMPQAAFDVSGKPFADISGHEVVEAILNGAYCTAVALRNGNVEIGDFTPEALENKEVTDLALRTRVMLDKDLPVKGLVPMTLRLKMKDGQVIEKVTEVLKGDPANPLSPAELEEKFSLCAKYSARSFTEDQLKRVVQEVRHIDERSDLSGLISAMTI